MKSKGFGKIKVQKKKGIRDSAQIKKWLRRLSFEAIHLTPLQEVKAIVASSSPVLEEVEE